MSKLINEEKTQISHAEEFQIIYVDMVPSLLLRRGRHLATSSEEYSMGRRKKRIILQRGNYWKWNAPWVRQSRPTSVVINHVDSMALLYEMINVGCDVMMMVYYSLFRSPVTPIQWWGKNQSESNSGATQDLPDWNSSKLPRARKQRLRNGNKPKKIGQLTKPWRPGWKPKTNKGC